MRANADAPPSPEPAEVADVVAMLDTLAAADVRVTVSDLEDMLARLRPMAVRGELAAVPAATIRAALTVRAGRAEPGGAR